VYALDLDSVAVFVSSGIALRPLAVLLMLLLDAVAVRYPRSFHLSLWALLASCPRLHNDLPGFDQNSMAFIVGLSGFPFRPLADNAINGAEVGIALVSHFQRRAFSTLGIVEHYHLSCPSLQASTASCRAGAIVSP